MCIVCARHQHSDKLREASMRKRAGRGQVRPAGSLFGFRPSQSLRPLRPLTVTLAPSMPAGAYDTAGSILRASA